MTRRNWTLSTLAATAPVAGLVALLAVLTTLGLAVLLLAPVLGAAGSGGEAGDFHWIPAAPDGMTRNVVEGEAAIPPGRSGGAARSSPRQYFRHLDRGDIPDGTLAIYLPATGGSTRIFFNRVPLRGPVRITGPSPVLHARGQLVPVPGTLLHPGPNRIDVLVSDAAPYTWPRIIRLAATGQLETALRRQGLAFDWLPRLATATGVLAVAVTLLLVAVAPGLRRCWMLAALAALATGLVALPLAAAAGLPSPLIRQLGDLLLPALAIGLAARLSLDVHLSERAEMARAVAAAVGLSALLVLLALPRSWPDGPYAAAHTLSVAVTLIMTTMAAWLQWRRPPAGDGRAWISAPVVWLAISGLAAGGLSRLDAPGLAVSLIAETHAALAAGLALAAWLTGALWLAVAEAERMLGVRRSLTTTIRAQEQKLDEQAAIIAAETRRSAMFEERDRMTRDIHDGIGGQLLSLLMRVRAGAISQDDLARELQGGLNDLRLIVDSLDISDSSLGGALATFHSRLRPQLDAAGITLQWRQDDADLPDAPDPRVVLNISRILQEVLTNVVQHARATIVQVTVSGSRDPDSIDIVVRDNGVGLTTPARPGGRGLPNLARRADDLGAQLVVENNPDAPGVRVRLHVPIAARSGEPAGG